MKGALYFCVDSDELVRRLSGRRTCGTCGATYHVTSMPPRREGVCDHCGFALTQRADDAPESIITRLREYENKTAPLLSYYESRGILHRIDSNGAPQEIFDRVRSVLREALIGQEALSPVEG